MSTGASGDSPAAKKKKLPYALTMAICSRNRLAQLERTVDTLIPQQWDKPWEILIVDNASNDGTHAAMRRRSVDSPVPFTVIRESKPGLSHARNLALGKSQGNAIVFLDDDVDCQPGLVAAHGNAFARKDICATAGRIVPVLPADAEPWFSEILPGEIGGPTSRYDFDVPGGPVGRQGLPLPFGANMGVRRRVALDVGGFRTDLGWGKRMIPSEEIEFFNRVKDTRRGYIFYLPEAIVHHRIEASRTRLDYYRKWQQAYGRSLVLMGEDRPEGPADFRQRILETGERLREDENRLRGQSDFPANIDALREVERTKGELSELKRLFFVRYPIKYLLDKYLSI